MKTNLKKIITIFIISQQQAVFLLTGKTSYSPFKLFNRAIANLYDFGEFNEPFEKFRDFFYNAVIFNEPLPEFVIEQIQAYYKGYTYKKLSAGSYKTAVSEIKEEITNFMLEENLKNYHIKKNEIETAAVRELVFSHYHDCNAYSAVRPLITWAENNDRLDYNFIYRMFEYGYIMGKRAERQKRAGLE